MTHKKITIQSIADQTGVSVSTVSRVLSGVAKKYRISDKTIALIHEVAEQLAYTPNTIAQSLRLKKTRTIGLILPDISNPWFSKIALKIETESRRKGYNVFLCNSNGDLSIEIDSLSLLEGWKVDGVIIVPIGLEPKHLIHSFNHGLPIVLVDRFFEKIDIPYVSTNDFEGAYEAVKHLTENGHTNIACVQGISGTSQNTQRVSGYKEALKDAGLQEKEEFLVGDGFGVDNGYTQAKELLQNMHKMELTAIFSTGNQISLGILKAFKEAGIRVPEDISLISFDEQDYSDFLQPAMTTVSHSDDTIGERAVELLFAQIHGETLKHPNVLLPTHLIKRASVKKIN